MSNDRQLNYVNNLQNRDQNLYYVDDASELNSINLKENDKIYAINDNKLFQMEIVDQEEELSGSIVNFNGRNNTKIKSLVANIEPVQDLHGYDYPWPTGGGKNLLFVDSRVSQITAGVTYTSDDDFIYLNGTKYGESYAVFPTLTLTLQAGTYYAKAFAIGGTVTNNPSVYPYDGSVDLCDNIFNDEKSFTLDVEKTFYIRFGLWNDNAVFTNYKIGIVISKTSGIDKFYSYSNICPINGWTGAEIMQRGKNLLSDDYYAYDNISSRNYLVLKDVVPPGKLARFTFIDKDTSVTLPSDVSLGFVAEDLTQGLSPTNFNWALYGETLNNESRMLNNGAGISSSIYARHVFMYPKTKEMFDAVFSRYYVIVELGDTKTNFEEYHSNQISVTFSTKAGTVYGGTLMLNPDRTGTLVVTHKKKKFSDLLWGTQGGNYGRFVTTISDMKQTNTEVVTISDIYKSYSNSGINAKPAYVNGIYTILDTVKIYDIEYPEASDLNSFRTSRADSEIVYELAEPQIIQLTADQVSGILTTFYGTNNIWSDIGDITVKIAEKGITAFELEPHI